MMSEKWGYKRELPPVYKYTLANLNLRTNKSTDASIITVIPKGSKIQVLDSEEYWLKVIYGNNKGYVYKDYVSTSKYPWSNLNLREDKSINSKIITVIPKGERIEVLDIEGDWSKVVYNDTVGYVYNYFLSDDGKKPSELEYKYFYTDMTRFVNENNIKSPTNYLLTTDLKNKNTYVYKREDGQWVLLYKWKCTVGKSSTPTITGTFYINGRKPSFGTENYSVKYATRIKDGYYYHSILYDSTGTYVIDSRLGQALSHGCIRLETSNAKWIYENILDTTTIVIK